MADQPPPPLPVEKSPPTRLNLTAAFVVLRLFMGFRLVLSAFEKMGYFVAKGTATLTEALTLKPWLGTEGFPPGDSFGNGKMAAIAGAMTEYTLLPKWLIKGFLLPLPYLMLVAGVLILIGLFNRLGWFLAGFVWFSLAFGQMLLPDEGTVQQLGVYLLMCAVALILVDHNRIRLTRF